MTPTHHTVIDIPEPGPGFDALVPTERPVPEPGAGEILVRVHAAGVNLADTKQRRGTYDLPPGSTSVPGLEISGEVVGTGTGTTRFSIGDRLCALVKGGGYAEYVAVPEVQCLPVPGGLSMVEAAGLPETVFTVWMALDEVSGVAPGETVLVHGGAGGIGTTAIQIAAAAGARVFATAGSDSRCERCVELGAELAVNYNTDDFAEVVEDRVGAASVDVIVDTVGAPYIEQNLRLLAVGGRLCYLAGDGGRTIDLDLLPIMQKRIRLTGGSLRRRPVHEKGVLAAQIEHRVWPWVAGGALRPQVGLVLPLGEAPEAHRALEGRQVTGKAILVTDACVDAPSRR